MRYAQLNSAGEVVNLVEADQATIDTLPDVYVALDDTGAKHGGIAVQIGDVCTDVGKAMFSRNAKPEIASLELTPDEVSKVRALLSKP